jgi:hypothetical protein
MAKAPAKSSKKKAFKKKEKKVVPHGVVHIQATSTTPSLPSPIRSETSSPGRAPAPSVSADPAKAPPSPPSRPPSLPVAKRRKWASARWKSKSPAPVRAANRRSEPLPAWESKSKPSATLPRSPTTAAARPKSAGCENTFTTEAQRKHRGGKAPKGLSCFLCVSLCLCGEFLNCTKQEESLY